MKAVVLRRLTPILILAVIGVVSTAYILVKQRFPIPFRDVYTVKAVLPAADGVAPGFGQAVNVSGVKVGTIVEAKLEQRQAVVTLEIDRKKLKHVYKDATADLKPVTPLNDLRIELDPGTRRTGNMPDGGLVDASHTTSPTQLATLLNTLDSDTRGYLTTLLDGLGRGTENRAPDIRRILLSFGPTVGQLRQVSKTLEARRTEVARLVHNVDAVTRAANDNGRLASLVVSGNKTLDALADQDEPLREALARFPGALATGDQALRETARLSDQLRPAVQRLTPPARRLRGTLRTLSPVAGDFTTTVRKEFRPMVRTLQPLAKNLGPAAGNTSRALPDLTRVAQLTRYFTNQATYNPPGKQEGILFYLDWAGHNFSQMASQSDAHGNILRVLLGIDCNEANAAGEIGLLFKAVTGSVNNCPQTPSVPGSGPTDPAVPGTTGGAVGGDRARRKPTAGSVAKSAGDSAGRLLAAPAASTKQEGR